MREGLSPSEIRKGQKHRAFRPSFDARECETERDILQVLDYMHANPVSKKWSLVEDFVTYQHSSAAFYELNEAVAYPVTHYRDL